MGTIMMTNHPILPPRDSGSRDLDAVTIESERLILRPVSDDFAEVMFREFTPEITRFMVPKAPSHIDETRSFIRVDRPASSWV